jgi:hypothetical protein
VVNNIAKVCRDFYVTICVIKVNYDSIHNYIYIHIYIRTYEHIHKYIHTWSKMADDVNEGIETALNTISSTTERSANMNKELKHTIYET